MSTIYPTGTCFDDALDYLVTRVKADPRIAHERRVRLAHGIALIPEGQPGAGERFAHAWVEEADHCYTMGILRGERVLVVHEHDAFYLRLRIERVTHYTIRQAYLENLRTNHYGPWKPEYLALCRNIQAAARAADS